MPDQIKIPKGSSTQEKKMDAAIDKIELILRKNEGKRVKIKSVIAKMDSGIDKALGIPAARREDIRVLDDKMIVSMVGRLKESKTDIETFNNTLTVIFSILGGVVGVFL